MVLAQLTASTALSEMAADMGEFVYFQRHHTESWIRIGYTDGRHRREDKQDDFEPTALIHATSSDEKALHNWFSRFRVDRKHDQSTYTGDEIFDYVTWLLTRGLAARNRYELDRIGRSAFSSWKPTEKRINEHRKGQLSLVTELPARDRVEYARADLPHLSSESDDWYTPREIIEHARQAMGSIDLDPASCLAANQLVGATTWYSKAQDGLRTDLPWSGNVWLNPPYGRGASSAGAWVERLIKELGNGEVRQAITCLSVLSTSAGWFAPIWQHASVSLIYKGRPNFWNETHVASAPTKGVILSYFGENDGKFCAAFRQFGVLIRTEVEL